LTLKSQVEFPFTHDKLVDDIAVSSDNFSQSIVVLCNINAHLRPLYIFIRTHSPYMHINRRSIHIKQIYSLHWVPLARLIGISGFG